MATKTCSKKEAFDRLLEILDPVFDFANLHEDAKRKTEICRAAYAAPKRCRFGAECDFAHSITELNPRVFDHINFKKQRCSKWPQSCQYNTRCLYLHDEKTFNISLRMKILYSRMERRFRIIHDQGNGTVCAFTIDSQCRPKDKPSQQCLRALWAMVKGDYKELCSIPTTPVKKKRKKKQRGKSHSASPNQRKNKARRKNKQPSPASPISPKQFEEQQAQRSVSQTVVAPSPPPPPQPSPHHPSPHDSGQLSQPPPAVPPFAPFSNSPPLVPYIPQDQPGRVFTPGAMPEALRTTWEGESYAPMQFQNQGGTVYQVTQADGCYDLGSYVGAISPAAAAAGGQQMTTYSMSPITQPAQPPQYHPMQQFAEHFPVQPYPPSPTFMYTPTYEAMTLPETNPEIFPPGGVLLPPSNPPSQPSTPQKKRQRGLHNDQSDEKEGSLPVTPQSHTQSTEEKTRTQREFSQEHENFQLKMELERKPRGAVDLNNEPDAAAACAENPQTALTEEQLQVFPVVQGTFPAVSPCSAAGAAQQQQQQGSSGSNNNNNMPVRVCSPSPEFYSMEADYSWIPTSFTEQDHHQMTTSFNPYTDRYGYYNPVMVPRETNK